MVVRLAGSVFLLMAILANGQQFSTRFRKIDQVSRAHQNNLFTILKDSEGYIWFSVDNGLARYDASTIIRYTGKSLLDENNERPVARIVFEDSTKNLFTVTSRGKLLQYNRLTDRFTQVNDSTTLLGKTVKDFIPEDKIYWVAHLGEGLARVDLNSKSIKWYKNDPANPRSLRNNFVTALARDKRGTLWVATTAGLLRFNQQSDDFDFVELTNKNADDTYRYRVIRSLAYDSVSDRLFIGTYGGFHIVSLPEGKQEHHLHNPKNPNSLSNNSIFKVLYDYRNNGLWICTYGGGLNYYNLATRIFQRWYHDPADYQSLGSDNVPGIYLDPEGLLWVTTAEAGLYVLNTKPEKFNRIVHQAKNPNSISNGLPRAVYAENDSIIWIGFNGTGLNRMNLKTGYTTRYVHDPSQSGSLAHNAVIAIDEDRYGRIWVGLEGGGVAIFDSKKESFHHLRYQAGKNGILNDATSGLLVDDDWVWITAFNSPLTAYNMETGVYKHFNADSLWKLGISFYSVRRIRKSDNNIWFETNHGTVVFDKQSQTFQKLLNRDEQVYTVFVNDGSEAFNDVPQEVQLLLTGNQVHVAEYRPGDSLRTRLIYDGGHHPYRFTDLVMDRNKVLWIATEGNIVSYNTHTQQERIFDATHGLEVNDLYIGFDTDKRGRIYTKSNKGLVWFEPLALDQGTEDRFDVKFTTLKIFNQEITVDTDLLKRKNRFNKHISYTNEITLKPSENFFSLSFTAFHFQNPSQVSYRYRLLGFSNEWVDNGSTNFASFTNLSPGRYTLEVMATTNPQVWGSNLAAITIDVLPPFWRTWWFTAGVLGLVGVLLYGAHQYRVNQKLEVERLRTKIASDLHDEVGSSLTRISIYSDLLDNGVGEREKKNYLTNIKETSREVVSTMSDIVWSVDNRSDKLGDLLLRMKDFAAQLLSPKNIEFEFTVNTSDDKILLSPQVKQNLYLIYKEALHNIVKHARAKHVHIRVEQSVRNIVMQIADDGVGFLDAERKKGNGLQSMRKRADDIHAKLELKMEGGTSIRLDYSLNA
ncbi:MAG TPA: two-component regulator propeller domain-containing protein [Cyclobacteriaceae bacterium]|nr:two-component regulator propeller domain-containing protein [Cyclobacteriaceae bacterium]HRJ80438.1 two-component regulator propeller domain-containing protein [Cyclobacteriaceae bacterium]